MSDITEAISQIDAYLFKYKPEAQEAFSGQYAVDDNAHVGVMAQELQNNPVTEGAVKETPDGLLTVDTRQLTLTLTAVCSELAKKVQSLESEIDVLKTKIGG